MIKHQTINFTKTTAGVSVTWLLSVAICLVAGCDNSGSNSGYSTYSNLESKEADKSKQTEDETPVAETEKAETVTNPTSQMSPPTDEEPKAPVKSSPPQVIPAQWTKPIVAPLPDEQPKRIPEVLVKEKEFRTVGPEDALQLSYDDLDLLKVINLEPVTTSGLSILPEWFKSLDGKRIRIRGIMFPPFEFEGLSKFGLARDEQACCFGPNAKVYHLIDVHLRDGHTTEYYPSQYFEVVGVFHLKPESQGEEVFSLYAIDDAVVIR